MIRCLRRTSREVSARKLCALACDVLPTTTRYITLIRHAESLANAGVRHVKNGGLTQKGIEQAKELSMPMPFDILYVSPMRRCKETLQHSRLEANRMVTLPELREYKGDACDFFEDEPVQRESEATFKARVAHVKLRLRYDNSEHIGLLGHADFFWEFTNVQLGHEHFNVAFKNAQRITFDRDFFLKEP